MIETSASIAPATDNRSQVYCLPESTRQTILAQSDAARTSQKIECQRLSFMSKNFGCDFGLKTE